uniref:protein phosphatase 1B-like isoform X3 n=1 Tax=Myxine glutinosa TaxID=7769 RepID=UPI00358F6555
MNLSFLLFPAAYRLGMGAFLDKPKTEKHNTHGSGNGVRYALSSMQGWRVEMEDAHTALIGLPIGLKNWSFFAVYDGHAGSRVATYCSEHLLENIVAGDVLSQHKCYREPQPEDVKRGIREGFLQIDTLMRTIVDIKNGLDRSGSTVVAVMVSPRYLYFINCGDSRAVLYRNGRIHFCTEDHKPCNPAEKERIQKAGGSVMIQRVNGSLAVSRALGDFDYKCVDGKGATEQLVSPEPEVYTVERSDSDEFVVLACDGVWDVMSNEELGQFVHSRLQLTDDLAEVCNQVLDTCLYKGSRDNMSAILICFQNPPKICPQLVQQEKELDRLLEAKVEELLKRSGEEAIPDIVSLIRSLSMEDIPNLPPGGGLASKRSLIEAVYNNLLPNREEKECEESTSSEGATKAGRRRKLLEALRNLRLNHRGNIHHVVEPTLADYRPVHDSTAAASGCTFRHTDSACDDHKEELDGEGDE